jgi:2-polyprenyl-3-methyl-5-hydroxy-6-metoxy-1,4-benzoquinol methylase
MFERIPESDWHEQAGHVYRYRLAADYLLPNERILDVACGIGYGAQVMAETKDFDYSGVDKIEPADTFRAYGRFLSGVDLDEWSPDFVWDVSVSFETLEHVRDPQRLAENLMLAKRLIICSTPTRPTKHMNDYHLHDFTVDDVIALFDGWELRHIEDQPEELSHVFVFGRPNAE